MKRRRLPMWLNRYGAVWRECYACAVCWEAVRHQIQQRAEAAPRYR